MRGNDGIQLEGHSCLLLGPELMETLRDWAAERHLEEQIPGLILLVAHLGRAGLVVADSLYKAGEVQGYEETTQAWKAAAMIVLGELRRKEGQ